MDWKAVGAAAGPLLTQMAPTIGSMIGGLIPIPGGSLIGQEAGTLLANAFGVQPTPEAVNAAIQGTPADIAAQKIQAAEAEAVAKWPALAQIAQAKFQANAAESDSINQTMRAELAGGQSWWSWRNLYGYSVGIEATATSWVILYALVWDKTIFNAVSQSFGFFMSWYGMRFGLLGYIHNGSSNEKIAAVTGQQPESTIGKLIKAVRSK
jgi:hypothetical protein